MKMIKDRVMVKIIQDTDTTTAGGVMLTSQQNVKEGRGEVICVGPGAHEAGVNVGDDVVYLKGGAFPTNIAGVEHHAFDIPSILYIDVVDKSLDEVASETVDA